MTRVYVTADPTADIKAIANTSTPQPFVGMEGTYYPTSRDMLLVSYDGSTFHTVLFDLSRSHDNKLEGKMTQPALGIAKQPVEFDGEKFIFSGVEYTLDETATVDTVVTKPIMRLYELVQTVAGIYVTAQNQLDGRSYDYLDGQPLTIVDGFRARGDDDDVVAQTQYEGHLYVVRGDHMDTTRQAATFDGQTATNLDPEDYVVVFADDLSTVSVKK